MLGIRATVYPCNSKLVSTIVYPLHNSCIIHIVLQFKLAITQNDTALTASTLYSVVISLWLDCISGQWRSSPIMYKPADYVSQNKYISVLIERLALKWRRPWRCAIKMQGETPLLLHTCTWGPGFDTHVQEALCSIPGGCLGFLMLMRWRISDALVQLDCYQHRCEWKDLWCSSTVRLLSAYMYM